MYNSSHVVSKLIILFIPIAWVLKKMFIYFFKAVVDKTTAAAAVLAAESSSSQETLPSSSAATITATENEEPREVRGFSFLIFFFFLNRTINIIINQND